MLDTKKIGDVGDLVTLEIAEGQEKVWQGTIVNPDLTPLDLTGRTFTAQIRDMPGGKLLASLAFTYPDRAAGAYTVTLSKADSKRAGTWKAPVWDFWLDDDPIAYGPVLVRKRVTR